MDKNELIESLISLVEYPFDYDTEYIPIIYIKDKTIIVESIEPSLRIRCSYIEKNIEKFIDLNVRALFEANIDKILSATKLQIEEFNKIQCK
ncbi:MAG: hypothetical protein RSE41_00395 [Clostridia bacterium]